MNAARRIHEAFQVSVLLKGAHALLELASGLAVSLFSPTSVLHAVGRLTSTELLEDPHDVVANWLLGWAATFSMGEQTFYAVYLLSHGAVKLVLVLALLHRQRWAYPASMTVLGAFMAYQLYRFAHTHGVGLLLLTAFDAAVVWLVWLEYRAVRSGAASTNKRRLYT